MRFIAVLILFPALAFAQLDSARSVALVCVHVAGHTPYGDLQERFGADLGAGGSFLYKTRRNWVFGFDGTYIFSQKIKEDVLVQLRNSGGFVVDNEGYPADLRLTERGFLCSAVFGKVLPLLSANKNSGLLVWVGGGIMQHKIKLYDAQQKVAAVKGDLAKGYDRFTAGFSCSEFIGYLFLSEYRFVNFYAGIEFTQGFTRSVRRYNYDTGRDDTQNRFDGLAGIRFGWILPLYKKKPDDFYYY